MQIPSFCRSHGCKNPKPILLAESDNDWSFQCQTCFLVQVVTKEKIKAEARWKREVGKTIPQHSWDKPRLIFDQKVKR